MLLFDELRGRNWSPPVDVYRTPTGWLVKIDLAGVGPEEVTVEASRSELRITGVRRDRFVREGYRHHSMEIAYSSFERVLRLPCSADECTLRTEFSDGMLLVMLDEEP